MTHNPGTATHPIPDDWDAEAWAEYMDERARRCEREASTCQEPMARQRMRGLAEVFRASAAKAREGLTGTS